MPFQAYKGGAVYVLYSDSLIIQGGTVVNETMSLGAVFVEDLLDNFTINGAEFVDNKCLDQAFWNRNKDAEFIDTTFSVGAAVCDIDWVLPVLRWDTISVFKHRIGDTIGDVLCLLPLIASCNAAYDKSE